MKDKQFSQSDLLAFEKSLKNRLQPITPDQDFVGGLHLRLEESPIYQQQRETAYFLFSIVSGLVIGLVIFLLGKGIMFGFRQT